MPNYPNHDNPDSSASPLFSPLLTEMGVGTLAAIGRGKLVQGYSAQKLIPQTETHSFSPDTGWSSSYEFAGPIEILLNEADKMVRDYKEADYRVNVDVSDEGNGRGTISLKVPTRIGDLAESLDDTIVWSLTGNDLEKDILTHSTLQGIPDADWDWLRKLKNNPDAAFPTSGQVSTAAYNIAQLIRAGTETYSVSQFVLSRNLILNSEISAQVAVNDVGKQYTRQQLIDEEGMPTDLRFATPTDGVWIKRTPQVGLEGTRYRVDGEFWHSDYASTTLYPAKT